MTSLPSVTSDSGGKTVEKDVFMRVEEISIVVLILALWMVAIGLFVHRWGKIRMLEPYQPDYKAIHQPNCPINPSSPTHQNTQTSLLPRARPPTLKALPRKSSSLCFTPSMLRTVHIPTTYRMSIPRIDFHSQNSGKVCPPPSRLALHRQRGRLSSDSISHRFVPPSELCRKARSAENLRPPRLNFSQSRSMDEGDDTPKTDRGKKSLSLENCRSARTPSTSGATWRGMSLDSAHPRKPSSATWWNYGMGSSCPYPDGRTTPEIRISPTPPEPNLYVHAYSQGRGREIGSLSHAHSYLHSRPPGLQRQEPLDETFYPLPYATLHEEENEGEEGATATQRPPLTHSRSVRSYESRLQRLFHSTNSSQESQDSRLSQSSQGSKRSQNSCEDLRYSLLTHDTKV